MPKARFDLYQVDQQPGVIEFGHALAEIAGLQDEKRSIELGDRRAILLESRTVAGVSSYLFTRVRMDGLPPKTGIDGHREDLVLDEDEGLGEDIAVAYDPGIRIVAVQRNRFSLSPSNIFAYVQHFFPDLVGVFRPILTQDALERFANTNILRKIHCKFAGTQDLTFLQDSGLSAAQLTTMQQLLSAPYVDVTFSVGRQRGMLEQWLGSLVNTLASAARNGNQSILRLEITGKETEESETEFIDLLAERLTFEDEVQARGRSIDTNHLMNIAIRAITANRAEIARRNL